MIRRNLLAPCRRTLLLMLMLVACGTAARAGSPPVAVNDTYSVHTAISSGAPGFLGNDFDPDGQKVYLQADTGCRWLGRGTLCIGIYRDGSFSYTPGSQPGTDTFTYQITDYRDGSATATLTFNVTNGAPVAGADAFHSHGQTSFPAPGVLGNDSDPDGDRLTLRSLQGNCLNCSIVGSKGWASLSSNGGFSYSPYSGAVGIDTFYYTVCDSLGKCSNGNITVTVGNSAPGGAALTYAVPAGGRIDIPAPGLLAGASDAEGDPVKVGGVGPPGYGASGPTLNGGWIGRANDGSFTYFATSSGSTGVDWFTYQVCDNFGACTEATAYFFVYDECGCQSCHEPKVKGGDGTEDPVGLVTGTETYTPAPDLTVYNPSGPAVAWQRSYYGGLGLRGYGSPGLSLGWTHAYDNRIEGPASSGTWGALRLSLYSGLTHTLTPVLDGSGQPTGEFAAPPDSSYLVGGVPAASAGLWQSITVTWKDGGKWVFTPFAGGQYVLSRVVNSVGRGVDLSWRPDRSLSGVSDTTFGAVLLTLAYDARGKLSSATDAYGRQVVYTFTTPTGIDPGRLVSVSQVVAAGAPNPPARYGYAYSSAPHQQLTSISVPSATGAGSATATINYDANGKVTSIVDANGNRRVLTYNAGSTVVQAKDPAGNVVASWTQKFDASRRDTGITDANNHSTSVEYGDPQNPYSPTRVIDRSGGATSYSYDQFGNVVSVTSARNVTTVYTWDYSAFRLGRLVSVKEGSKPATTFTYYEPSGFVQTVTKPSPAGSGTVTYTYTYDALGNVLTATGPGNNAAAEITTTYNYTTDGSYAQPAKVGQPLTVRDNLGHFRHLRYDAQGRVTSLSDALGHETNASYNVVGQLEALTYPTTGQTGSGRARSTNTYLYAGGPLTATTLFDEGGVQVRQVSYGYGPEGEVLSVSGSGEPVTYTYDALYRLKTLKDGKNNATTYSYDAVGNVSGVQMPGGETVQFPLYDPAGRVLRRIDGNGATTNYVYDDPESLLTDIQYPATPGLNVHFGYDAYGRRDSMTDGAGSHAYTYGDLDELKSVTTTYAGLSPMTISYGYNSNGSRKEMVTPAGTFAYTYDGAGRLSGLTNPFNETTSWGRYDDGRVRTQSLANGALTTYTYNAAGRLTGLTNNDWAGAVLSQFSSIAYDGAGNRKQLTAALPGSPWLGGLTSYQYDGKEQLTQEQTTRGGGFTDTFGYDAAGNPTSYRGQAKSYNANNQQTGVGYTHDNNGNPTAYGGVSLSFDPENRLTSYGAALTACYRGDGLRAWKETSQGRTHFLYDGTLPVIELDAAGAVVATNTFGGAALVSRRAGAGSTFYLFDPQGSVAQRTDASGAVISSHLYTAHGGELTTASADPFGYGAQWGYYTDRETGLQLLTHRYYDPTGGRFVTRDPIGYAGGVNLYSHVQNNPLNFSDPAGLDGWGNDLAEALDEVIDTAEESYRYDDSEWVANGVNASVAQVARGVVDVLRVGSGVGHALYDCDDNGYGRAAAVAQDIGRAAAIFQILAGPFAGTANCFVAGTLVQTAEGTKRIEEVEAGDVVLSADPAQPMSAGQPPLRQEVVRTFERTVAEVIDLHVGKEVITTTPEHPFWVVGAGWTAAGELRRGSALLTKDGIVVHVDSVERRKGTFKVYNFEVADSHTYFVSSLGLLVHNQCGTGGRRFIADQKGNVLIEPAGGRTVGNSAGTFVETQYPNGSPYQQLHGPHRNFPNAHGHGFQPGAGVNQRGVSVDPLGNPVPPNSPAAHWPVNQ